MLRRNRRSGPRPSRKASKKPKEISFHRFVSSLPRPFPDPQLNWHIELYFKCTRLKRQLDKWTDKPFLSSQDLECLGVKRGLPFEIDDVEPIDFEPRYFVSGASSEAAEWARYFEQRGNEWPKPGKLNWPPEITDVENFSGNAIEVVAGRRYCEYGKCYEVDPNPYWDTPSICHNPTRMEFVTRSYIGHGQSHYFLFGPRFSYKPLSDMGKPNKHIAHSLAIVNDTLIPDDRVLRSELLSAIRLLRDHLAQRFWPDHHTFPMLVFSFYSGGGGRILQMHAEDRFFYIRVSRSLNLTSVDETIPADGLILTRWLLAQPIGNTFFCDTNSRKSSKKEGHVHHPDPGATSTMPIDDGIDAVMRLERLSISRDVYSS